MIFGQYFADGLLMPVTENAHAIIGKSLRELNS